MGCFLACFGSSKDRKGRKKGNKGRSRHQKGGSFRSAQSTVSLNQDKTDQLINSVSELGTNLSINSVSELGINLPINSVPELGDKPGEQQLSLSPRKKVTFDSNVTSYEHVSSHETADSSLENGKSDEKEKGENLAKPSQSHSHSEEGSTTSSLASYPPNHRYQNCRDSDDEVEESSDYEGSDLDDDEEDDCNDFNEEDEDGTVLSGSLSSMESRTRIPVAQVFTEEVVSPMQLRNSSDREGLNRNARDRSTYVHPVLNPVQNLTQWKAVKAKGTPLPKPQKENFTSDQEPNISFSMEPSFKQPKLERPKQPNQIAVDTSLSNWLGSSESTTISKASTIAPETTTPEKSMSQGSNSLRSLEDRPILGALTVEEIKQFSASSTPRRSPSRSPDDTPIIGTVGTYWSHSGSAKNFGSDSSSYKGIPNTTSKYREDKKVIWQSTPFETRLERALNSRDAAKDHSKA